MKQILKFPQGFLWGAAGSAYQTEGNNTNSDWWSWEHSLGRAEELKKLGRNPKDFYSGIACDFYNRFDEDFALAGHLNHNATRFGVEWSRVEPRQGEYDETVLDHYEKMLQSAKAHGLKVFLTLHHYSNPFWFMEKGGFTKKTNVNYFVNFSKKIIERLGEYVDFWLTINEPEIYASHCYFFGIYPPQVKSLPITWRVAKNLILAHKKIAAFIRLRSKKPVGMAYQLGDLQPSGFFSRLTSKILNSTNRFFLNRTVNDCDFIGLNYYNHHHVGLLGLRHESVSHHPTNDLGWGIHPEGLERVLISLKKYNKPIYITENGLADEKDLKREKFIKDHLYYVHKAISRGADVRGYLYWSLMDNFEWAEGFWPRFGLIEIDRGDFLRRKVRYSATKYAEICKNNSMEY